MIRFQNTVSSFLFAGGVHISQNDHFIGGTIELPPTENENMRSDRGGSMTIPAERWLSFKLSFLPNQLIVGV